MYTLTTFPPENTLMGNQEWLLLLLNIVIPYFWNQNINLEGDTGSTKELFNLLVKLFEGMDTVLKGKDGSRRKRELDICDSVVSFIV
jgi:hypothetical protein